MEVSELNESNFKEFGEILRPDPGDIIKENNFNYYPADILNTDNGIEGGFLEVEKKIEEVKVFEKHDITEEVILPINGRALLYLAKEEKIKLTGQDIKVFRIMPGLGVRLKKGVWHAIPAVEAEGLFLCLIIKVKNPEADVSFTELND